MYFSLSAYLAHFDLPFSKYLVDIRTVPLSLIMILGYGKPLV